MIISGPTLDHYLPNDRVSYVNISKWVHTRPTTPCSTEEFEIRLFVARFIVRVFFNVKYVYTNVQHRLVIRRGDILQFLGSWVGEIFEATCKY